MKISLFTKDFLIQASFFLLILIYIVHSQTAYAGFFSNIINIFSPQVQGSEVTTPNDNIHNSQTIPLLESSINPDLKNIKDDSITSAPIMSEDALAPNSGPLGIDSDLEKYASSAKINIYVVKKGDTLKSIAKQLKVSESTILASNSDIKKANLLKVGQTLVILPIKPSYESDKTFETKSVAKKEATVSAKAKVLADKDEEDVATPTAPTTQVAPNPAVSTPTVPDTSTQDIADNTPAGQPSGTISGHYIWPLPEGVGRVSQGLHADQAYDFAAPKGTPIYAIQNGTVLIAHPTGYNGGYGLYVVINFDDGRQAIFGHMSKVAVQAGDTVKQGDVIGYVGSTGKSTGPHIHIGFHGTLGNPYSGLKVNSTDIENND